VALQIQRSAIAFVVLVVLGVALVYCSPTARGSDWIELDAPSEALAAQIWRVSVHEAGPSVVDVALIHQATLSHGETPAERLRWLRRHSPRVAGSAAPRRPWTLVVRQLEPGLSRPALWPQALSWPRNLPWIERALWWSRALVSGRVVWEPCPGGSIESWDGRSYRSQMVARGWVPVECGARNLGARRGD
jgi:hypothetical protein